MKSKPIFSYTDPVGDFFIRELDADRDALLVHSWVSLPYASFWLMGDYSPDEVKGFYRKFNEQSNDQAYLGYFQDSPSFIIELYDPKNDPVAEHYDPRPGDMGMHVLVAPAQTNIKGFTKAVFNVVMRFIFSHDDVQRVVVEPDCRNHKIHRLNKYFGFQHIEKIQLGTKLAYLGFCQREQYYNSFIRRDCEAEQSKGKSLDFQAESTVLHLQDSSWHRANRRLLKKCLAEFSHERIISPEKTSAEPDCNHYRLRSNDDSIYYEFDAVLLPLDHWLIDENSIVKISAEAVAELSVARFIYEFHDVLHLDKDTLSEYLEEIQATLYSSAYKYCKPTPSIHNLVNADFQVIESAMDEGHPSFIANNARIGFDGVDFKSYVPESGTAIQLCWVAAHVNLTSFTSCADISYSELLRQEFDLATLEQFREKLCAQGLEFDDYLLIPVHPWQWFKRLIYVYGEEIANKRIVYLGESDDFYQAQQSIRTFFNLCFPQKFYIKTALSIRNMGFVRGLSAAYMKPTPAINDWVQDLIKQDSYLNAKGFSILREIAAIGFASPQYEGEVLKSSPLNKTLAALWRESPVNQIHGQQKLMTMAALLHIDSNNQSFLSALIETSALDVEEWLARYLDVYLAPLLHCYFAYGLVFMPHGENVILVMEDSVPAKIFMKDIGEEVCLLNSSRELPPDVARISVKVPEDHEQLSIFTDVFDCFFRYLSGILYQYQDYQPENFWRLVANCVRDYQLQHPQYDDKYQRHDLFAERFALSCLNRLQLRNSKQMIDLNDPSKLLQFAGEVDNPIAPYRFVEK